ncbi:MAG: nicotinamide mononucleotide transporter [Opitutaceae bacterium]|nr:nicotinamide mononucleotide transporter [Opitutaceae bacterium]
MSAWEIAGTALGVLGVWLMIRRNLWAFPVGMAQVVIFGWVCYGQRLYSETVLQAMFFAALAHGWWHWRHPEAGRTERPVGTLPPRARAAWVGGTLLLWLAWGTVMHRATDAALPYADAFVFAASVASQWLQARKLLENWPGWLVANTAAVAVFTVKELYLFAGLYAGFWVMAVWGWCEWRRSREAAAA